MGCFSSKSKHTGGRDTDSDGPAVCALEYRRDDNVSLDIYEDYSLLYSRNTKQIQSSLSKEEIIAFDKIRQKYTFVMVESKTESLLLYGSGTNSYTDLDLSREMKTFIFTLIIRLDELASL